MNARDIVKNLKGRFGGRVKDVFEKSKKRVYLTIEPKDIKEIAVYIFRDMGLRFNIASAVDSFDCFEILYHFADDSSGIVLSVRTFLNDKKAPRVDSLTPFLKCADWIEREIHELFGIEFDGHPNMRPLLLSDDWPKGSYPLRKDFKVEKRDDRVTT